ncbi:MAG: hypothetical protein M3O09_00350 [Acidobacteriota bacterium]|nr:hypothetical protein [Acidobacteriota bacterium]
MEKMDKWEKALWLAVFFIFTVLELRSIYADRTENDEKQRSSRATEQSHFEKIANDLQHAVENSDTTILNLQDMPATGKQTLENTQPYATVELVELKPLVPVVSLVPGQQLRFNAYFTNMGKDEARHVLQAVGFYFGKIHDLATERQFATQFEKTWAAEIQKSQSVDTLRPHAPAFQTHITPPLTEEQIKQIHERSATIYVLVRFAYTDTTGNWLSDVCLALQDPAHDLVVSYPCRYHSRHRYRSPSRVR